MNTVPSTDELLAEHWPMPDSFTPDHLLAAVRTASELLRFACHATLDHQAATLPYASSTGDVANALRDICAGMSQLAGQVGARVVTIADEPNLRHDMGGDPQQTLHDAAGLLGDAAVTTRHAAGAFDQAFNALSRIGHVWTGDDDEQP